MKAPTPRGPAHDPHPLFLKSGVQWPSAGAARTAHGFLSTGGAFYHLSAHGVTTRAHLYNYFPLLAGEPFDAEWSVRAYAADGKSWREEAGRFQGADAVALPLDALTAGLGEVGVCVAHIRPVGRRGLGKSFDTVCFSEYLSDGGRAYLHSMGYPVPKAYTANDCLTTSLPAGGDPVLLLANASDRAFGLFQRTTAGGRLRVTNGRGDVRETDLPVLAPLAACRFRLKDVWPDLEEFMSGREAFFSVHGPNVLYSPLFWVTLPNGGFAVEHFQGLDWEGA